MSRILIVEDENATAWAVAESLADDGHHTTSVASAEEALDASKQDTFDLIITDVRLPGMNGLKLARQFRSGHHALPVIVLTAYGSRDLIDELDSCGVHAIFPKPFRVDQLRRTVREALRSGSEHAIERSGSAWMGSELG